MFGLVPFVFSFQPLSIEIELQREVGEIYPWEMEHRFKNIMSHE